MLARALAALIALAMPLITAAPARAHAVLLATEPVDGEVLPAAPGEMVLRFNEPVTPIALSVIGPDGRPIATEALRAEGAELRATLPRNLATGSHLASYRVVSADAHPIGGALTFAVGTEAAPLAAPDATARETSWLWLKIALRLVQDIGLMFAAGGALFQALVLRHAAPPAGTRGPMALGAVAASIAAVLGIGVQGGLLLAGEPAAILAPQTWGLGASGGVGLATLLLVLGMALVLAGLAGRVTPSLAALGAVASCVSLALTGHSAAAAWPAQPAMALHVVAAAYWMGALWPLHRIVQAWRPEEATPVVRRFSSLALVAVTLLAAAGLAVALTRVDDVAELIAHPYGRLLAMKLLLIGALLALATLNRYRYTPWLAASRPAGAVSLRRSIAAEIVIGAGVLVATALLAHTPPPYTPARAGTPETARTGYSAVTFRQGYRLEIDLEPARRGPNDLVLRLVRPDNTPLAGREVRVALSLPVANIEPLERPATSDGGDGRYRVPGIMLPVAGDWTARVDVLVSDFEQLSFSLNLTIR